MFALAFMFLGMLVGFLLRKTSIPGHIARLFIPIVCALLFAMGMLIGHNPMIMDNLHTLGLHGFLMAFSSMVGSAVVVSIICRLFPARNTAGSTGLTAAAAGRTEEGLRENGLQENGLHKDGQQ